MNEQKNLKIIIPILVIILVLTGGFLFFKNSWINPQNLIKEIISNNGKTASLLDLANNFISNNKEQNFLILFQNNLELRPSGGYLGNFGILKIKDNQIISFETHDTNIFDGFSKVITPAPEPIQKYLKVSNWQMRDSGWSPDFETSARQAEYFYHLQGGKESFDGVIAVNASILPEILKITGPIYLKEFNQEFNSDNVLYELEYQVEKGYVSQGLKDGDRKKIFKALVGAVVEKFSQKGILSFLELKDFASQQLNQKNIQLYFSNSDLEETAKKLNWAGEIKKDYKFDYLMISEANLGGRKSNYFITRNIDYTVDLTQEKPKAKLIINFKHTGKTNDWFNADYKAWVRIYIPEGSWISEIKNIDSKPQYSQEFGKTYVGFWVEIKTNSEKMFEISYDLPEKIKNSQDYHILIQKQSGIKEIPISVRIKTSEKEYLKEKTINSDWEGMVKF